MGVNRPIYHVIANGCSQTSNGVGGCPPSESSSGGCSFVDCGDGTCNEPGSWAGIVAQQLKVKSFVNLAAESHGNYYIMQTFVDFLSRHQYPIDQTLAIFNVSEPSRLDLPCSQDHPDRCNYVSYGNDILPYSWFKAPSRTHNSFRKNIGIEQAQAMSRVSLITLFAFLEQLGLRYLFITMHDYREDADIGSVIKQNHNRIDLVPGNGIVEFGTLTGLLKDEVHPNLSGHDLIAQQVLAEIHQRWTV